MAISDTAMESTMPDQDALDTEVTETTDAPENASEGQGDPEGADQLGDPGKRALDSMKVKWQAERDKRKALSEKLAAIQAEQQQATGEQPDPEAIREQARAEARAEVLRDRALDKAVAKAAGRLADPEDARVYLAANVDDLVDGDGFDLDAITDAIDELVKNKPYLAAAQAPRFQGSADGGARNGPSQPAQLTRDEVKRMSHQEIVKAQADGRLDDLLSGK